MLRNNGIFITIEGIDGTGKSTQAENLAQWLEERTGQKTMRTFEPGGWPEGKMLREFILDSKNFCAMSELLLFLADRAEHVNKIIIPELESGHNVICERYNESTLAYQSGGHELEIQHVKRIIEACNFPEPDVKILLDIEPEIAFSRVKSRNSKSDKFEGEGLVLMRKVSEFYKTLPGFMIIECNNSDEQEVFRSITAKLEECICQSR